MKKSFRENIKLVSTIVVCTMFFALLFSNTTVRSEELQRTQIKNEQQPTKSITPLAKILATFKFLNWNFWDNPPHIFSRNLGNVGIGGVPPSDAKLYVKTNNISMNYTIFAEGGLGIKSVSTILEGTGITGEGGHAGVCGNGYIGLLGVGFYGGWFEGKGYFSGNVSIGTSNPTAKLDVNGDVKTSGDYKYASQKVNYLSIHSSAFECCDLDDKYYKSGLGLWLESPTTQAYFVCPINLPQGATVTEFQAYLYDNDGTYDILLHTYLASRYIYSTSINEMADMSVGTTGTSNTIQAFTDTTIQNSTIDNANYQYYIYQSFNPHYYSSNLAFYGCRIIYTMDTIAP